MNDKIEKRLQKYIKDCLSKGYSLISIRKGLITHGYDCSFVENLIRNYERKTFIFKTAPLIVVLLLVFTSFLFLKPSFIGFVAVEKHFNYTESIDLEFNESSEHI